MGRARIWQGLVGLYFALWLPLAGFAQDGCRQALALALDVSGSVDAREYRLQIGGLIAALDTSAVRNALLSLPGQPVELLAFEWSGAEDQHVLVDWTAIHSREDIAAFQERLRQTQRRATSPGTAIGHALETGHRMLDQRPDPAHIRTRLAAAGITVNALVIGADSPTLSDLRQADIAELSSYFRANVIAGPDAFVQTAIGYEGYAEAMARKLERELQTMVVSGLALQRSHSPR
jgi:hypothetical protein